MKINEEFLGNEKLLGNTLLDYYRLQDDIKASLFYLLGVFYNRGSIRKGILTLETSVEEIAKIVANKLEKISVNVRVAEKRRNEKNNTRYIIVGKINEYYWKIFQDIVETRNECKLELEENANLRRMFLRGFFDIKGFLNVAQYYDKKEGRKKRKMRIRASSINYELLNLIQKLLKIEGINSRIYCIANKNKVNKLYVIEIQGRNSIIEFKNKISSERKDVIEKLEEILRY